MKSPIRITLATCLALVVVPWTVAAADGDVDTGSPGDTPEVVLPPLPPLPPVTTPVEDPVVDPVTDPVPDPADPADPGVGDNPENPADPQPPENPEDPGVPEDPASPGTPGKGGKPEKPAKPEKPVTPAPNAAERAVLVRKLNREFQLERKDLQIKYREMLKATEALKGEERAEARAKVRSEIGAAREDLLARRKELRDQLRSETTGRRDAVAELVEAAKKKGNIRRRDGEGQ